MTLRKVLNELQGCITETFTEDMLLDTEIKVETMSTTGDLKMTAGIKDASIQVEQRYSSLQHKKVPLKKDGAPTILLKTTMVP